MAAPVEQTYMLINLKDASSTPFCSLDDLYTWVCREKGANLEKNVADILELCKRMDGRLGTGPVAPLVSSIVNKEITVPFNGDSMALLLTKQTEPVETKASLTLEEKLRSINEFNVPSHAIPLNYTDYKEIRKMTDSVTNIFNTSHITQLGFPKEDPEFEADRELNKADAMKRMKETADSADKSPLPKMDMKLLEEWFTTNTHAGTENYVTPYCFNLFLTFYDGTRESFNLHGFPSVNNLPTTLTDFFKHSYSIPESPPTSKNMIDERYFQPYRIIVDTLSKNGLFHSENLAFGLYRDYHKNRVSILTLEPWVLEFLNSCCKHDIPEESTKSSVLYSKFVEWIETMWDDDGFESNYYLALKGLISQKAFSTILKSSTGLKPIRKSDGIYWPGISLGRGKGIPEKEYPTLAAYDESSFADLVESLKPVDNKTLLGF